MNIYTLNSPLKTRISLKRILVIFVKKVFTRRESPCFGRGCQGRAATKLERSRLRHCEREGRDKAGRCGGPETGGSTTPYCGRSDICRLPGHCVGRGPTLVSTMPVHVGIYMYISDITVRNISKKYTRSTDILKYPVTYHFLFSSLSSYISLSLSFLSVCIFVSMA